MSYFGIYPSIELQALDFVQKIQAPHDRDYYEVDTEWNGFSVHLYYLPKCKVGERKVGKTLYIADMTVPEIYQSSKWLLQYLEFCALLAEDALMVKTRHDWMVDAMSDINAFESLTNGLWLLELPL